MSSNLQLTKSNLAALEEGGISESSEKSIKYLFRIGISKSTAYDYIYSEEKRSRYVNSDRIGPGQPVPGRLYFPPDGAYNYLIYYPDFPPGKQAVLPIQFNAIWDQSTWARLVHNELVRIKQAAQDKRNKLQALVVKCPYKAWSTYACERMWLIPQEFGNIMKSLHW